MRIELIMTGEELLDGRITNTNESDIARLLAAKGFSILRATTVGDGVEHLRAVFREVIARADIAIMTGGLGPTDDDRTVACLAEIAEKPLVRDPALVEDVKAFFARLQRPMTENNLKQADIPEGAEGIPNPRGSAPGVCLSIQGCLCFALPGVPHEMRGMMDAFVLPRLLQAAGETHTPPLVRDIKCFGAGESQIAALLSDLYPLPSEIQLGYRAHMPEIHLRLSVRHPDPTTAQELLQSYSERIEAKVSKYLFGFDQDTFIGTLATLFREQKKTLALAESCTGGLIAHLITAEAGASAYFNFSAVTYSNDAKMAVLNVPREAIETHGAVSEAVVRAMSEGARRIGQTDIAVAVSGIAGPDGGSPEKPVGTVDIAIATPEQTYYRRFHFPGDRERIQIITAYAALQLVRRILQGQDPLAFQAPEKTKKV